MAREVAEEEKFRKRMGEWMFKIIYEMIHKNWDAKTACTSSEIKYEVEAAG